ncbi:hypothetical protein KKF84_08840 [Myxococcota bacterium]|nr:hypothetical protein [Myxococcota bacterium]
MKKLFIFVPAVLMGFLACTGKRPAPTVGWRICPAIAPGGNTVSILPIDVRVNLDGKSTKKEYTKIWRNAVNSALTLQRHLPDFLASRRYRVQDQVLWSGRSVNTEGRFTQSLSERDLAQAIFSLAHFSGKLGGGSLKHSIAPKVFQKLSPRSDLSLYVANWYNVKIQQTSAFVEFLKVTLIVVGVAVIVFGVVTVIAAVAGSKGGGGGGDALGGILKIGGKLFVHGAKGLANVASRVFIRSIARTAGRVALHTARVATRVAVRVTLENGPIIIDIPQTYVVPAYEPPAEEISDAVNRYLGVQNGVSSLRPVMSDYGYMMVLVLVNNRTGAVVWDGRVLVPQGAKTEKVKKLMQQLFSSMPAGVMPLNYIPETR